MLCIWQIGAVHHEIQLVQDQTDSRYHCTLVYFASLDGMLSTLTSLSSGIGQNAATTNQKKVTAIIVFMINRRCHSSLPVHIPNWQH